MAPEAYRAIRVEDHREHLLVVLNRPEVRNAIDEEMVADLHRVFTDLERTPQMLVLTGEGSVFAGGADLRQMRERGRHEALRGINSGLFGRLAALPLPTIAVVNGPAIGGGAELAYACDFRLASNTASFANPEVTLGIMPAAGASWRLRELVGISVCREMLLAGRVLNASEAFQFGLVNEVVETNNLPVATAGLLKKLAAAAPLALQLTKLALLAPDGAHPRFDDIAQAVLFETAEKRDRMTAFLEKRTGRQK